MKLLVGLGNYGGKYDGTRHNLGWMALVSWMQAKGMDSFRKQEKFSGVIYSKPDVACVFPETYMNRSGECVIPAMKNLGIELKDVLVLHDDLDLPPNTFRLKFGGGSGGHNGLRSIDAIAGQDYWRLRLGIGKPDQPGFKVESWVLSKFGPEEIAEWGRLALSVQESIDLFLANKPEMAMNKFNRKTEEKKNGT
ncbi:MAG: aminoacyl-tRNA hydrolase [Bdellovibrionota bacterium]